VCEAQAYLCIHSFSTQKSSHEKIVYPGNYCMHICIRQSSAQIQKGETMLGASLGFGTVRGEQEAGGGIAATYKTKSQSVHIMPELGFGLGNNWIVGIGAGYVYSKQETETSSLQSVVSKGFTGAVFVRKFYPIAGKFGIFGQGNVEYASFRDVFRGSTESKSRTNRAGVAIQPGAYIRATNRFIVEAYIGGIGYTHSASKPADNTSGDWKNTVSTFNASFTNDLALSFKVVL
jgi:hypothetical protein